MKRAVSKMMVPVEHTDWWKDVMTSTISVTVWRDFKNREMRRLADLGFHASLRAQGQASLSPRQPAQHLYGCLLQHAFSLCFLRFLGVLACISCNPFVSMMNLHSSWEVLEEGRTWCDIRESYSQQVGTHPAVSGKGHHSVNLARPSWRRLP